jgi:hypothetical protein
VKAVKNPNKALLWVRRRWQAHFNPEIESRKTLVWVKRRWQFYFNLKETGRSEHIFASLEILRRWSGISGTGVFEGKKVEMKIIKDGLYSIITYKFENDDGEWGRFRCREYLRGEPGVLKISDGREYYLLQTKWNKFRLYTKEDRTVIVTTYQSINSFKVYLELFDIADEDPEYPLLAMVSLMPIGLYNGQIVA